MTGLQLIDCDLLNVQQAAEAGDPTAMLDMCDRMNFGDGVAFDDETYIRYLEGCIDAPERFPNRADYWLACLQYTSLYYHQQDWDKMRDWIAYVGNDMMNRPMVEWDTDILACISYLTELVHQETAPGDEDEELPS